MREKGAIGAIGIFDSGVGGLTVLKEIIKALPHEDCIYLGDTARIPYGTKSPETVRRFAQKNTEFLVSLGIKYLVVACNTAASAGLDLISSMFEIPVSGVIEPGAGRAVKMTKNKRIGVIATRSTISSEAYQRTISQIAPDATIFVKACPLFVPLAEEGETEGEIARLVTEKYLDELIEKDIDTLVLGCTHYPLLKSVIAETVGYGVTLIDSAVPIALEVRDAFKNHGIGRESNSPGTIRFYVTDDINNFKRVGEKFLGFAIENVEHIDIIV